VVKGYIHWRPLQHTAPTEVYAALRPGVHNVFAHEGKQEPHCSVSNQQPSMQRCTQSWCHFRPIKQQAHAKEVIMANFHPRPPATIQHRYPHTNKHHKPSTMPRSIRVHEAPTWNGSHQNRTTHQCTLPSSSPNSPMWTLNAEAKARAMASVAHQGHQGPSRCMAPLVRKGCVERCLRASVGQVRQCLPQATRYHHHRQALQHQSTTAAS
jgi:hypothetical protein